MAAAFSTALLSACAGHGSFLTDSAEQERQAGTRSESTRPKRASATRPRDVLAEWGTFGIGQRPLGKARTSDTVRTRTLLPQPDHSESIQEIVANAACHACDQKPYHRLVVNASIEHGVPSSLIHAVIRKESGYKPSATSRKNARGLMQVTPATARFVGVTRGQSLYDPQTNINAGTAYLKYLMRTHDTFDEVLAAYNSGPGNVRKYNGVPPFQETRRYVVDVKRFHAASSREAQ